jgi:hypothetical protein
MACGSRLGFHEGSPGVLFEHMHHYRQEFDSEAAAVLEAFAWSYSPLHPEDEQYAGVRHFI